jgi:hypothetical protein
VDEIKRAHDAGIPHVKVGEHPAFGGRRGSQ